MLTAMRTPLATALVIFAAACGHPAGPAGPTGPTTGAVEPDRGPPAVSLERIERIARACLADRTGAPLDWTTIAFAHGGAAWRVRVDETKPAVGAATYVDVMVDPAASTCDGRAIASQPADGDTSIDTITAIAKRCHAGQIEPDKTDVAYHRLTTGDFDRGKFDVTFVEPGVAVTRTLPHYVVDFAAGTCKQPE